MIDFRIYAGLILLALMMLWPNFVHEPIHYVLAEVQGVDAQMIFEWKHLPPRPVINWQGEFSQVGLLIFLLGPSIVLVALLLIASLSRATIETHISFPIYAAIELVSNIMKFNMPTSDFRMLQYVDHNGMIVAILVALVVIIVGTTVARAILDCGDEDGCGWYDPRKYRRKKNGI